MMKTLIKSRYSNFSVLIIFTVICLISIKTLAQDYVVKQIKIEDGLSQTQFLLPCRIVTVICGLPHAAD